MPKQCRSCGAISADAGARFCSACGDGLGDSDGIRQRVEGGTGNAVAAANSTIQSSFNTTTHHHGAVAPPLDLSPSHVTTARMSNKAFLGASAVSGLISVVSGLFGIFGTDVLQLMGALGVGWEWLKGAPFYWIAFCALAVAGANLFLYVKHVKLGLPSIDGWPFVRDDRLNWIVVRRVCPRCRGTMAPKKHGPDPGGHTATTVWECSRNRDHWLPFDRTEVEDAISEGKLEHLLGKTT